MDETEQHRIVVVFPTKEAQRDFNQMIGRVAGILDALSAYNDRICEIDEDDPDIKKIANQYAAVSADLTLALFRFYPHGKEQFDVDVQSLLNTREQ